MHGEHEAFRWVALIPGLQEVPNHMVMAPLVAALLVITCTIATIKLKRAKDPIIPDGTLSYLNFFDLVAEKIYGLCEMVMGEEAAAEYFPVIGTLFIFIFACNLSGLIPGFVPPTENVNVTFAAGFFVFLYYNLQGFKKNGFGYLKHFLGPVLPLAPLMLLIEIVSHLVRPLTLGLRLFGNMMGDHTVLGVFLSLVPYGIPVIFYGLGLFVALVQALVFCLLTMVYINLSIAHDH